MVRAATDWCSISPCHFGDQKIRTFDANDFTNTKEDPMTDAATEDLINTMLDSKKLGGDATEDLKDFLQDIKEGNFHRDDEAYVHALADRLGFADGKAPAKGKNTKSANASNVKKADDVDWHERAVIAEARVEDLEEEIEELKNAPDTAEEPAEPAVDVDELRGLLDQIYDSESGALREVSNEEAAGTLKLISEKLG